jgi:hypothetical protein
LLGESCGSPAVGVSVSRIEPWGQQMEDSVVRYLAAQPPMLEAGGTITRKVSGKRAERFSAPLAGKS